MSQAAEGHRTGSRRRRGPEEKKLLDAHTRARQEYRAKMHELRLEFQKEASLVLLTDGSNGST